MFDLGTKNELDEANLALISVNLGMFNRWMSDNCGRMLTWDEAKKVSERILDRENFSYGKDDLLRIIIRAFTSDVERTNEFRAKIGFDGQIDGFCERLGIAKP